jgi:hypothetical protein
MQIRLGVSNVRREPISAHRTFIQARGLAYELRGDPADFDAWAAIIEHVISVVPADEFQLLVGDVDVARTFARRLRKDRSMAPTPASLWRVEATAAELQIISSCLNELIGGPSRPIPDGLTGEALRDMAEDLGRQLR